MQWQNNGNRVSRPLRLLVVGLSAIIALIYLLIGLRVLEVVDVPADQTSCGLIAAGAFALGALAFASANSRFVFGLGAAVVAFVIIAYFAIAPERSPEYETWGIMLKVLQAMLLVGLGYLAIRPAGRIAGPVQLPDPQHPVDATTAGTSAESGPAIHINPPV